VIESPVWTPQGSKFSMEQITTALSSASRMTSISYSFQPRIDSSTSTSPTGERSRPRWTFVSNSSRFQAMPEPEPPSVKLGRMTAGRPISASTSRASGRLFTIRPRQVSRPIFRIVCLKISRSSPRLIASAFAPIISTPCRARMPRRSSSMARLSAVWPPSVGSTASGFSISITFSSISQVSGST
jgi:hypothetical protein